MKPTVAFSPPVDEESLGTLVGRRIQRLLVELEGSRVEGLYPVVMRELEKSLLETVLAHTKGEKKRAAQILGLHRNSLRVKLRACGLESAPERRRRRRGTRTPKVAKTDRS